MFLHTLRVIWEIFRKIKNFIPEPETYCALLRHPLSTASFAQDTLSSEQVLYNHRLRVPHSVNKGILSKRSGC